MLEFRPSISQTPLHKSIYSSACKTLKCPQHVEMSDVVTMTLAVFLWLSMCMYTAFGHQILCNFEIKVVIV